MGRRPGDVWHVDLTAVPTRAGFWVTWLPFAMLQRWPFCWWVGVVVDQVSRRIVGYTFYRQLPSAKQVRVFLARAIRRQGSPPRCIVSDKGSQFRAESYRRWCKGRDIRVSFGKLGEPSSIPVVERFIRSMKEECFRWLVVPLSLDAVRRELAHFTEWYNHHRPHSSLGGITPEDLIAGRSLPRRIEPRNLWPRRSRHRWSGQRLELDVSYVAARKHLPVIKLRRAA